MIARSCGLCRQCISLLLLVFQISGRSSIRKTFIFHFLPMTSYRFCLPDVCFLSAKRQRGPAGWGVSCVPANNLRADTEYTEERQQGVQAVPPCFYPLPEAYSETNSCLTYGFSWQMSPKWLHSLCLYTWNVVQRCRQLVYLHLVQNSCFNLLGSNPFPSTQGYLVMSIHRWYFFYF